MRGNRRFRFGMLIGLLIVAGLGGCARTSGLTNSPTATAGRNGTSVTGTPSAAGAGGSGHSGFRGIFQFTGTPQVNDTALSGGMVIHYWSELEPAEGQFNWAPLDQDIATWTSHGKKVVLRIPFSSSYHDLNATPQWVYNLGVPSVKEVDGSVHPQYWSPIFLAQLKQFIAAYGVRYNGNPNIVFIDAALGGDGESIVDTNGAHSHTVVNSAGQLSLWQKVGYTDAVWWQTIQTMLGYYKASFPTTPLAVQVVKTFIGGTKGDNAQLLLAYAAQHGFWLQDDAEYPNRTSLDPLWTTSTLVLEPGENSHKQGSTLLANLQNMLHLGATYDFVFASDLKDPAGIQAINWAAAQEVR